VYPLRAHGTVPAVDATERYGVFLRPDPRTCAAVTAIASQVRAQYGFVSAGAFPPHATLAGSLPLAGGLDQLVGAVSAALDGRRAFPVENAGLHRLEDTVVVFDIHTLDGAPNAALIELAASVDGAVRPLLGAASGLAPDTYEPGRWHGHLSLASHELLDRADLRDEVEEYIGGLGVAYPARFLAEAVAIYRFTHPSWTGAWWETMRWEHARTFRLLAPG
jgi:2'-5' RNA ligase superfamily